MMDFFEFFFSGTDWGWRIFALILLVYAVGDIIVRTAKCFFNYRLEKYITDNFDEIIEHVDDDKGKDKGAATKDDVRS